MDEVEGREGEARQAEGGGEGHEGDGDVGRKGGAEEAQGGGEKGNGHSKLADLFREYGLGFRVRF